MVYGPVISAKICKSCDICVDACPMDVLCSSKKGKRIPVVKYPDECWYCGSCYMACPTQPPAITLVHPLNMRLAVRKVK